jgi:hypothetical protein
MVIHHPPVRLRRNSDQPTAITDVLAATSAIRQFLTDPDAQDGTSWPATRPRTWSNPATGYWLSGPTNQPGHNAHTPSGWPGAPARPLRPLRPPAALPGGTPRRGQPDPSQSPEPAPQRAA